MAKTIKVSPSPEIVVADQKEDKEVCSNCGNIFFVSNENDRKGWFVTPGILKVITKQNLKPAKVVEMISKMDLLIDCPKCHCISLKDDTEAGLNRALLKREQFFQNIYR